METEDSNSVASFYTGEKTTLMYFKKEQKTLIWTNTIPPKLVWEYHDFDFPKFDIGQFPIIESSGLLNGLDSLGHPERNLTQFIILPNDPRINGKFEPCFACPHSSVETYAKLELLVQEYFGQDSIANPLF